MSGQPVNVAQAVDNSFRRFGYVFLPLDCLDRVQRVSNRYTVYV